MKIKMVDIPSVGQIPEPRPGTLVSSSLLSAPAQKVSLRSTVRRGRAGTMQQMFMHPSWVLVKDTQVCERVHPLSTLGSRPSDDSENNGQNYQVRA